MILISFALLAAAFMTLSYRYMVQEKKEAMAVNVTYVASLTQDILEQGFDPAEDGFRLYGPALSMIADCDILICDNSGTVLRYTADGRNISGYVGERITPAVVDQLVSQGCYSGMTDLGLYPNLYFTAGVPIYFQSGANTTVEYLIFMTTSAGELIALWKTLATIFFFIAVVVLCIAFISSSIFSLQQVKPLREMADAVRRFGMGEYDVRVADYGRKDEIGDLATAFNAMADSLACSEKRRQEFVANISHELKTPMTTIGGYVDGILDGTIPPERERKYLSLVSSEIKRLSRLVRSMLDVSRLQDQGIPPEKMVRFDVAECLGQVLITFEQKINDKHLDVAVNFPEYSVYAQGELDAITQVAYNLIDNAVKFCPPGGQLGLSLRESGSKVYVSVSNTGDTIPPEELPLVFDRFHKIDKSRSLNRDGWGLGLYIVKTIICSHGEDISVTSRDGKTEFTFTLAGVNSL